MNGLDSFLSPLDWGVVVAFLVVTTVFGYALRGRKATARDFFLGGRSLPWPAVSASLIATEISALAFIGIPGALMAVQGDFTYLQWVIGSLVARFVIGYHFVKVFYSAEYLSPYDYMGHRISPSVKTLATGLFTLGALLGHSARLLFAASILTVVTPLTFEGGVLLIVGVGVVWTVMGGVRSVVWTDLIQLLVIGAGVLVVLFWIFGRIDGGGEGLFASLRGATDFEGAAIEKLKVLDFRNAPSLEFTFWIGLFAVPFLHLATLSVDQTHAQRLFCCRGPREAQKAVIWSSLGQGLILLLMVIGAALFVFYREFPPTDPLILEALSWSGGEAGRTDLAFPVWMVSELPAGLRGLLLAAILAAALSSLDAALAALSQTSLSLSGKIEKARPGEKEIPLVRYSRWWVGFWGIVLVGATLFLREIGERTLIDFVSLALGLSTDLLGPMLGFFLVARFGGGRGRAGGLLLGLVLSGLLVGLLRESQWRILLGNTEAVKEVTKAFSLPWLWPLTTLVTLICGWDFRRKSP